ncbi:MAG: PqqD family protein [Pseudomonadota bacterium]
MTIDENQGFVRSDHVVVCEIKDGGALLDLETSTYFQLNSTANFIWEQLADGPMSGSQIAAQLAQIYDVDDQTALSDVLYMLDQFGTAGLVVARG